MGVLDFLFNVVSVVYFMYYELIYFFNLGKFGVMREIVLVCEVGYWWWYFGYYVYICVKMRYKIDY